MVDKDFIGVVARRVRAAYCYYRSRMSNQQINPGKAYGKYWVKAAMLCVDNRITPEEYVEVQFHALRPYPEIPQICGQRALTRYFDGRKDRVTTVAEHVMMQMSALEHLMGLGKDVEEIFSNPFQEFDQLFRFLILRRHGREEASENHKEAALSQYLLSVYYDDVYKDLIPEEFKLRGRRTNL